MSSTVDERVSPRAAEERVLRALRSRVLDREVAATNSGWEDVLIPLGALLVAQAADDEGLGGWARGWIDHHLGVPTSREWPDVRRQQRTGVRHRGVFLTPYCGEWGVLSVLAAAAPAGGGALLERITEAADYVCDESVRVGNGAIAHSDTTLAPWVDTLYYSAAPLARAYAVTGVQRYAEEAVRQCLLQAEYLRDERTGLFFHDADPVTGRRTDWFWSRGNGWVIMAFADVLELCPATTPGWDELLRLYRSIATGLLRLQHPSGLWRIVPENPESHLETSGTTMIATGLAVGVRAGWLEPTVASSVTRAWNELVTWIDDDGRLLGSQTPAGPGGWETHKKSVIGETTYGTGCFLRFAAEVEQLGIHEWKSE